MNYKMIKINQVINISKNNQALDDNMFILFNDYSQITGGFKVMVVVIDPQQAGISGNMVIGALVNLGADSEIVKEYHGALWFLFWRGDC